MQQNELMNELNKNNEKKINHIQVVYLGKVWPTAEPRSKWPTIDVIHSAVVAQTCIMIQM